MKNFHFKLSGMLLLNMMISTFWVLNFLAFCVFLFLLNMMISTFWVLNFLADCVFLFLLNIRHDNFSVKAKNTIIEHRKSTSNEFLS